MTDESILYIFKFPKVCILIVAFIICFGRLIIQLVASFFILFFEFTKNIVDSRLMYCNSTPSFFVKGYFALKPLTNQVVKQFCVQDN